jgi:hypothetical protein
MDDHRRAGALTDETLDGDIARLVALDPSPEFVARVRTRIAEEPAPRRSWLAAGQWRRASALRWACFAGGPVLALIVVAMYANRSTPPVTSGPPLAARSIETGKTAVPYVASALRREPDAPGSTGSPRAGQGHVAPSVISRLALPELVEGRARATLQPLFDARETRALQTLIANVRDQRIDLTPLLQPGAPPPMELPPIDELRIAPITIDPIAPSDGAQGVRP